MSIRIVSGLLAILIAVTACDQRPAQRQPDGRPLDAAGKQDDSLAPDLPAEPPADGRPAPLVDAVAAGDVQQEASAAGVWSPAPGTPWHWQLQGALDTAVQAQMYDIDLFDTTPATIAALRSGGRAVICYFSAGSHEDWRPDAASFPPEVIGSKMDGWDESWLDIRAAQVRQVMATRLDLAQQKGCDGVEPDNVDGYANETGFALSFADQLAYNKFLASEAHARGLSVGLKNDLEQVQALEPFFDWALNEECMQYSECHLLQPFIAANKAVFHVEYAPASKDEVCSEIAPLKFDTQIKNYDLDAWFDPCWD